MIVFVYGSLLRGEQHHGVLGGAAFLGSATTARRYALVDLGEYPGLFEGGNAPVTGELYELDGGTLAVLDDFEGHPVDYERRPVELSDGTAVHAYLLPASRAEGRPRIVSGDWRAR